MHVTDLSDMDERRRRRMGVLALAPERALAERFRAFGEDPAFTAVRGPETGLMLLRGRMGGTGKPFNFGEATVTRATVRLSDGAVGHALFIGRDAAKAQIAAVIDALAGDPQREARIEAEIIAPLEAEQEGRDAARRAETAATRVEFFTLVRGED